MRTGRPKAALVISDDERVELVRLTKRSRIDRHVAFRARIVLACADVSSNSEVARLLRVSAKTVGMWRRRFVEFRVDALYDEPRVGAPRKVSDEAVEAVIVKTLETTPKGRTHWSTRKMAKNAGISHSTVGRIWRAFGLKPHLTHSFKMSPDPQFIEKVRDIVGLYMSPPDHAAVFCFDEKSQIQALERAQPVLPMDLGQPERRTGNYLRHGTLDLFAALNVATGSVIAGCKDQHRGQDFVAFLREVDENVEAGLAVHVKRWLLRHPRFQFHFTPTYSSWMNLVERFFGLLTEEALKRGSHTSIPQLRDAILAFVDAHNEDAQPFKWTKTADEILDKVRRFGLRTQHVHAE
jgi:transposase